LDVRSWTEYIDELAGSWQPDENMAYCVVDKDDVEEEPLAIAIANKRDYRHQVGRVKELDGARSRRCLDLEEQWCVEYVVRSRLFRGRGVGSFVLAGLVEAFCARFADDGMLWLQLAGGFPNTSALSLYTAVGFIVTSLCGAENTPIMSLQVRDPGIRERAVRVVRDTLVLRVGGDGGGGGGGVDVEVGGGGGAGVEADGGMPVVDVGDKHVERDADGSSNSSVDDSEDDVADREVNLRRRRRRRRRREVARKGDVELLQRAVRQPVADRPLHFRTIEEQFTLLSASLVLPPKSDGLERDMVEHLWAMSERTNLHLPSQSFLIHLNLARQCHTIATTRRMHVSRWLAELRQENRDNLDWMRRFGTSLANDVMLLWFVFRMPCLALLKTGYSSACRSGGLKDIVRSCEERVGRGEPLPIPIINAQKELHK
jgi:GNAT superfamily N-acetyltransferase